MCTNSERNSERSFFVETESFLERSCTVAAVPIVCNRIRRQARRNSLLNVENFRRDSISSSYMIWGNNSQAEA